MQTFNHKTGAPRRMCNNESKEFFLKTNCVINKGDEISLNYAGTGHKCYLAFALYYNFIEKIMLFQYHLPKLQVIHLVIILIKHYMIT